MSLQSKVDHLIEDKGLTKTKFAAILGVSRDTVYNLNENSKLITYMKICKYFKISLSDLIDDQERKPKTTLSAVAEESEVYGVPNYRELYYSTLEKLNACNERVIAFTDLKKDTIKKK